MNAFPLPASPRPIGPRRVLGGILVAVVVIVSIWLMVAAGLQQGQMGSARPGPLPDAPSTIQADLVTSGLDAGAAPLPGPEIAPVMSGVEPR